MALHPQFDHVFDQLTAPSILLHNDAPEYSIAAVNKAFLTSHNAVHKNVIGKSFFETFYNNSSVINFPPSEKIKKSFSEIIVSKTSQKVPCTEVNASSIPFQPLWLNMENKPILVNGKIAYILHTLEKDPEIVIPDSSFEVKRKLFLDLFSQAPSCMGLLKGPDHIFEIANNQYQKLIGKYDIIGQKAQDVLPELEFQGFFKILEKVYTTGETFSANEMLIHVDRNNNGNLEDIYLNFIYQPHKDKEGKIDGIYFFATEVTEQVLTRKKIEESKKRFQHIVETAQEGIWLINKMDKTSFVNTKMAAILGFEKNISENKIHSFIDKNFKKITTNLIRKKKGTEIETQTFQLETTTGENIWVNISSKSIFTDEDIYDGTLAMVTDITAQKNAEKKEKISELRYKSIIEQAIDAICIADPSGKFIEVNPVGLKAFGYTHEEITQLNITDLLFKEDLITKPIQIDDLKEGYIVKNERRIKRKDGTFFFAETHTKLLISGNMMILGRNIDERKRAAEKDHFQSKLLNTIGQAVVSTNIDGIITYWNTAAEKLYGWSEQETVGRRLSDLTPILQSSEEANKKMFQLRKGQSWSGEFEIKNKNGKIFPIYISNSPIYDDAGNFMGIIGISNDISERKISEKKLIQSEKRLKESQKIAKIGNWELTFSTNKSLWSDETCKIFGVPLSENIQTLESWLSFIHPEDLTYVLEKMEGFKPTDKESIMHHRIKLRDGNVKYIFSKCKYDFDNDGQPIGMYGINVDISERKKFEINLENQNIELIKANKELDRFVYSASHDLRSPLTSILGLVSLIEEESNEEDTLTHIKMIRKSIVRLDGFIKNILNYSQNNRAEVHFEKISIKDTIEEVISNFSSSKEAMGIYFEVKVEENHPFISDRQRFLTIIENLVSNAIKHHSTRDLGKFIRIDAITGQDKLTLKISDNGKGIDPIYHDKIFNMFYRISQEKDGSGIGLYIVKEAVEKLNGTITLQSQKNQGATFIVTLKNACTP